MKIKLDFEMPWTSSPCIPCRDPICPNPETCQELDLWVRNIPISRPPIQEIHPPKIKQQIPHKTEKPILPLPEMKETKKERIDNKMLFGLVKSYLALHPDSTKAEIVKGIPDFKQFKRPDSSLWAILVRYGNGEVQYTNEEPSRLRLKESELIEINVRRMNLK